MNAEINMNQMVKAEKEMARVQSRTSWLAMVLVSIGVVSQASMAKAASFSDTFTTGIDSGVWTTSISPAGTPTGTVAFDTDHVKITQSTNEYANLRHAIGPDSILSVFADINNVSDAGQSWAPAVALYWDANNWVKFNNRANQTVFAAQRRVAGAAVAGTQIAGAVSNTWYTMEIKLNYANNMVEFYHGPQFGSLIHDTTLDFALPTSFLGGNAYVIIGKGYGDNSFANAFLNNDASVGTGSDVSLFDNVIVNTPEPTSLGFLGIGAMLTLRKRRA